MDRQAVFALLGAIAVSVSGGGCRVDPPPPRRLARPGGGPAFAPGVSFWRSGPLPRYAPREVATSSAPRVVAPRTLPRKVKPMPPPDGITVADAQAVKAAGLAGRDRAFALKVARFHRGGRAVRVLVETDRPLYRPGETIWARAAEVRVQGNRLDPVRSEHTYELVTPRGTVAQSQRIVMTEGHSHTQFDLDKSAVGGEYTVRVRNRKTGHLGQRKVVVGVYQSPRLKKRLTFVRRAYGAGDSAEAVLTLHRATGQPLGNHRIRMVARLGGKVVKRWTAVTNANGEALVALRLPRRLGSDDGLLNVLVEDGGVTESIARPIPLVLRRLKVGFFPEGGKAVWGLSSRVYFSARRSRDGKPVDFEGEVRDGRGRVVARVRSLHDGMGRFLYTPTRVANRPQAYTLHITRPRGIDQTFRLPTPAARGVTLQLVDDYRSGRQALALALCAKRRARVVITALQHETLIAHRAVWLEPGRQRLTLPLAKKWRGIVRVTVFDSRYRPLAERLVFRNRGQGLRISVRPDKPRYQPRDTVTVKLRATTPDGKPVPGARLGAAVVDDTALSFADDHEPHWLAQRYLTGQVTGRVHRASFYFDPRERLALRALDLVMGTHGWRDFRWSDLKRPGRTARPRAVRDAARRPPRIRVVRGKPKPAALAPRPRPKAPDPPVAADLPVRHPIVVEKSRIVILEKIYFQPRRRVFRRISHPILDAVAATLRSHPNLRVCVYGHADRSEGRSEVVRERLSEQRAESVRRYMVKKGVPKEQVGVYGWGSTRPIAPGNSAMGRSRNRRAWFRIVRRDGGKVGRCLINLSRAFPTAFYETRAAPGGVRRDFRDTVFWDPDLQTDKNGEATVKFGLPDSVTSFRFRVSGVGQGRLGLAERLVRSSRPFHMVVKAPLAVSAQDGMVLPLTLRNESKRGLRLRVAATLSNHFNLVSDPMPRAITLPAGRARTYFYPIRVTARSGNGRLVFRAVSNGLQDAFEHKVVIRPRGVPRTRSWSGVLKSGETRTFDLTLPVDLSQASPDISLSLYPNPLATVTSGMEGMLREPCGCFEQASSANYPNVMILQLLKTRGAAAPTLKKRAQTLIDRGYRKLAGYETKTRGYEWFGASPGHEALTAYGLVQFTDMVQVYSGVSKAMIRRTAGWLLRRRDGRGRYRLNQRALDTFGRASPDITAAYVTYSLAEAGHRTIPRELQYLKRLAGTCRDPYVMALAISALVRVEGRTSRAAASLVRQLLALQQPDGRFQGRSHSITRSTGRLLHVETTSLAIVAMIRARAPLGRTTRAVLWLRGQRNRHGSFGSTQSTILALRALVAFDRAHPPKIAPGRVAVRVNGRVVQERRYGQGVVGAVSLRRFARALRPGHNRISVKFESTRDVPFSFGVRYYTRQPATAPGVKVALATRLDRTSVKLGETVRLTATVKNRTPKGLPMVLARIGYPGAFRPQTWQLKALVKRKRVAFYETRPREIILYFRGLPPGARRVIPIDLVARVTGRYMGPASSAYLYYANDEKAWTAPVGVNVVP